MLGSHASQPQQLGLVRHNHTARRRSSSYHQVDELVCLGGTLLFLSSHPLLQLMISQLLGNHIMTNTLPTTSNSSYGPLYWVAGKNDQSNSYLWKGAVYNTTADIPVSVTFEGLPPGTKAQLTVLTGPENPYGYNDPWTHVNVVKTSTVITTSDNTGAFTFSLPALSVAVLDTNKSLCSKKRSLKHNSPK